jgi:hypothetical protein
MYTQLPQLLVEIAPTQSQIRERERSVRLRGVLSELSVRDEKVSFERSNTPQRPTDTAPRFH